MTAGSLSPAARLAPTKRELIPAILRACNLRPGQTHMDLGSGDGRVVVAAAQLGATSIGIEIDAELASKSSAHIKKLGAHGAAIVHGDMFDADVSRADAVTFWFGVEVSNRLMQKLRREMKPGSRAVEAIEPPRVHRWHSRS